MDQPQRVAPPRRRARPAAAAVALVSLALAGASAPVTLSGSASGAAERSALSPRKLALIVAVEDYANTGYLRLHAAHDVALMTAALRRQGFDSVVVLRDRQATAPGVLAALRDLRDLADPGDVVWFHYSGHGHRITDDDGDELDGYDEVLAPYGAPGNAIDSASVAQGKYRGERHVRDDQLRMLLTDLRRELGPRGHLVVSIDACYSGSGTRGVLPARGKVAPLGPPRAGASALARDSASGLDAPRRTTRGGTVGDDPALAPAVTLSASRYDQLAQEVEDRAHGNAPGGAFSIALGRALATADSATTYRALFERVRSEVASLTQCQRCQEPQIEGQVDMEVLSGRAVTQQPFFRVADVDGDTVRVAGGTLLGLLPGTLVELYPAGTRAADSARLRARGEVRSATPLVANVVLTRPAPRDELTGSWAFVRRFAFPDIRVDVRLDPSLGAIRQGLADTLAAFPLVRVASAVGSRGAGAGLVVAAGPRGVTAFTSADSAAFGKAIARDTPDLVAAIADRVRSFARVSYLRSLSFSDPRLRVDFDLVPATHTMSSDDRCVRSDTAGAAAKLAARSTAGNELRLTLDDEFVLRVNNRGTAPAYVVILDLMPDGTVAQVFPDTAHRGDDNQIRPGESRLLSGCLYATDPVGRETLKLFATTERIDFEPAIRTRGQTATTRGDEPHPLEALLAGTFTRARGVGGRGLSGGVSTFERTFFVDSAGAPRSGAR